MSVQFTLEMMTIITNIIICSRKTFYTDAESVKQRRLSSVTHQGRVSDATISDAFRRVTIFPFPEG